MKICNRDFINIVIESFIAVCKIASKKTVRVSAHISFNGYYHPFCIAGEHLKFQLHLPVIAERATYATMSRKVIWSIVIFRIWQTTLTNVIPNIFFCPCEDRKNMLCAFHPFSCITLLRLIIFSISTFGSSHSFNTTFANSISLFQPLAAEPT